MPVRSAHAVWKGTLKEGQGHLKLESGVYEGPYTWASRFAEASGTNPEELIGAAHAGCFAMFLSALLTNNNTPRGTARHRQGALRGGAHHQQNRAAPRGQGTRP